MKTNKKHNLLICKRLPNRTPRRGLTLTEILAAVFVLSFGLVAAMTVLPFATFQLNRMNIADSSGACGRGGLQQIRIAEWQKPDVLNVPPTWSGGFPADPYIVDPLGMFNSAALLPPQSPQSFPYNATSGTDLWTFTLNGLDAATVNHHFRWGDDTIFAPGKNSERPTFVERNDGSFVEQTAGLYTWLYMVTPIIDPQAVVSRVGTDIATTLSDGVLGYEVASVVFHRRDTAPDATDPYQPIRRVNLSGTPTINTTGAYITLQSSDAENLDLSSIKWILLTGQSQAMFDSSVTGGTLNAQWYRVTGYDDIQSVGGNNYERRVFLVGPDWKGAKDATGNPLGSVYAILCDGVVNVFQATMPK